MPDPIVHAGDPEPQRFPWGAIKWFWNQDRDPGAQQTFGLVFILPGQSNPRHYHPNCEEILYVLSGTCEHSCGEESYALGPGDSIRVPEGVRHRAVNNGWEPLRAIISFSSGDRQTVFLAE